MTHDQSELDKILSRVDHLKTKENPEGNLFFPHNLSVEEAKQAIKRLLADEMKRIITEDEHLVEVTKRNLIVAGRFNAVIKSRNSLRELQRAKLAEWLGEGEK